MKAQLEIVRSSSTSFVAFERKDPSFPFLWHYHPEHELTLIVDSQGQRLVGDAIADYGPGDLVLLGPNLPHSWRSGPVRADAQTIHRAVVVQFLPEFLGSKFFALEEMNSVAHLLDRSSCGLAFGSTPTGLDVARRLRTIVSQLPAQRLLTLLTVLVDLSAEAQAERLSTGKLGPISRSEDQQRINTICVYLDQQFCERIDYHELARSVHMDLASLCRFFKRATGRTMTTYVNELRVAAAAQLLRETDLNILEVGLRVGFGNYSNFNRQFKRMKGFGPRVLCREFQLATGPFERVVFDKSRRLG
jgi:AraC-like DNA-binding protein